MQAVKSDRPMVQPNSGKKYFPIVILLVIFLVIGIYAINAYRAAQPASLPQGMVTISQSALEEKYGLHVNLVAVTGAGGFVDLRLKIIHADKARLLLADKKSFPALFSKNGVILYAPEETKSQKIEFTAAGNLYIMYSNSGNAVVQGRPVRIIFGDIALEPINAK